MGIKLDISSELMENYKRFSVASAEKKMQAVCRDGLCGFLSVGDDGFLYLSYEKDGGATGWERRKLCDGIRAKLKEEMVVNTFAVSFDRETGKDYVLAAVKVGKKDRLFLSANGDLTRPDWIEVPLPGGMDSGMSIYDVLASCYKNELFLIVDFRKANLSTERYFICPDGAAYDKWDYFPLPADFTEIADAVPGRAGGEFVDGIYTIGSNAGKQQLLYTPSYNYFDPSILPASVRLALPCEAEAIATLPAGEDRYTHLFACGDGCLLFYPYDRQEDMGTPAVIARSRLFSGVKQLFSDSSNGKVYVWALNESKELVYLYGDSDCLDQPEGWSDVFLLKKGIDYAYPFRQDSVKGNHALFAYTKDGEGILGEESGETGLWYFSSIYMDDDAKEPVAINSYTTLIRVLDENKNPLAGQTLSIQAKEQCQVYMNGGTYFLRGRAVYVDSNEMGEVKIIQTADSASAIQFDVWIGSGKRQAVNPAKDVMPKLFSLNTPDKLKAAKIKSQSGKESSLVPDGAKRKDLEAVANALAALDKAGSQVGAAQWKCSQALTDSGSDHLGVHIHVGGREMSCHKFRAVSREDIRRALRPDCLLTGNAEESAVFGSVLTAEDWRAICASNYSAGDVFGFFRSILDEVFDLVIGFFEDTWHFIVKIGGKVVSFIISCIEEVIACAVEVFQLIKVSLEKLIEFLKFIFDMDDILRSKDVLKKIVTVSVGDMKTDLAVWRKKSDDTLDRFIRYIEMWAEIGDIGEIGSQDINQLKNASPYSQAKDVRSSYFLDMLVENRGAQVRVLNEPLTEIPAQVQSSIDELIQFLKTQAEADKELIDHLADRIQKAFMTGSGITGMDVLEILKKLAAIVASTSLEVIKVVIDAIFDLAILIADLVLKALTKELYIPCISEFLKLCGIESFSMLDIGCFVPAFMGTVMYKMVTQKQLLDEGTYQAVMKITSLSELASVQCVGAPLPGSTGLYFAIKLLGGLAAFVESCVSIYTYFKPGPPKGGLLGKISFLCNLADGACYAGTYFMYAPLSDKMEILQYSRFFSVIKYSSYLFKGVGFIMPEDAAACDLLCTTMFGLTSVVTVGADIAFLIEAAKQPGGLEKNVFLVDTVSLIADNLRNFGNLLLIGVEEPISHAVILAVRTICAMGYSGMQIAEGGMVL